MPSLLEPNSGVLELLPSEPFEARDVCDSVSDGTFEAPCDSPGSSSGGGVALVL